MHSFEEMGSNVPAFLGKLWRMVEDPDTNDLIKWSANGTSFIIHNQARFSRELLPVYYKHNNMASFVRQLNMYDFHKVVSLEGGGLKIGKDEMEFAHSCFLQGHPYLLEHIKRKIPAKIEESRTTPKSDLVNKVLTEVTSMKGRQDNLDSQLSALKRENEVLWREVAILRQKHLKQQQIVNKLIQFLISLVHSRNGSGLGIKRPFPLMLHDKAHRDTVNHQPSNNKTKPDSNTQEPQDLLDVPNNPSPSGPVIHELEASDLPEENIPNNTEGSPGSEFLNMDFSEVTQGEVHSPTSSTSKGSATASLTEPNCDVLLELVEEYPLSPELMTTASPADVNPCISSSKDKSKTVTTKNNTKKRKAKAVKIKKEVVDPQEVDQLNVGDFLEIVLPNFETNVEAPNDPTVEFSLDPTVEVTVDPTVEVSVDPTVEVSVDPTVQVSLDPTVQVPFEPAIEPSLGSAVDNIITSDRLLSNNLTALGLNADNNNASSLEAATNAAISAISSVAAASKETGNPTKEAAVVNCSPNNLSLTCTSNNAPVISSIKRYNSSKEDLDLHLGATQSELDSLKDLLKGEGYNLDANTWLGLFSGDPLAYGLHIMEDNDQNKENSSTDPMVSGSELTTYPSNLLDLVDLNTTFEDWSLPEDSLVDNYMSEVNTPQTILPDGPDFSTPPAKKRKK